jgi:hypothetical protein
MMEHNIKDSIYYLQDIISLIVELHKERKKKPE